MTNNEFANHLIRIAEEYVAHPDLPQPTLGISIHFWDKTTLVTALRKLGGKWQKTISSGGEYYEITREDLPLLKFVIARDKVCKKVVTWDCEPLLSPEEEREVALAGEMPE